MSKPTKIEKVKGCEDCSFQNIDYEWGTSCTMDGSPDARLKGKPYPSDCPLLVNNIQVELDT